jgi:PAS domain S-box-containing protein
MGEKRQAAAAESSGNAATVRRPATLRSHLVRLTLATLLPVIALAVLGAVLLAQQARETFERGARERTLALITAIDAELHSSVSVLTGLAQSVHLERGELEAFHEQAARVAASRPDWLTVNLTRPSGQQIVNVLRPYGSELPEVAERASFERVLSTGRPVVGDTVFGSFTQRIDFPVRVPVLREGRIEYVLTAVVSPDAIAALMRSQRLPPDWIGGVVDGSMRLVARTVDAGDNLGHPAAPSLQAALQAGSEGWFLGRTREGIDVYTPFNRSPTTGWSVALGIPVEQVNGAAWRAMGVVGLGAAAALLLAVMLAMLFGRRLAQPIAELAEAARHLGESSSPTDHDAPVLEVADLRRAIAEAARLAGEREEIRQRLLGITSNATVALFMTDEHQHCSFMNPAAERMSGYTLAELAGRPLHDLLHLSHPDGGAYALSRSPIQGARPENDRQQGEAVFVHKNGQPYPVAYAASPIRREGARGAVGASVGTIIEVREIGEQKAAEAARLELLAREQHARSEAEQANRAKDEFLAMLGHELRNPLSAISNASHLLDRSPAGEHAERARGVIRRQVMHLARLVDDLLDAGRVATGKIVVARDCVDLAEVVRRTVATLAGDGRAAQHRLSVQVEAAQVEGDETRLEQVVTNLLTNALRYTPAGGSVRVTLAAEGACAVLTVADSGIGIAPAMLERVFELFVQGERGIERRQGGLGIGLTLVRRLVELHGGSCTAHSAGPDQGSTFTVRLPLLRALQAAPVPIAPPAVARRRVLIIEDNDDAREMLAAELQLAGHEVLQRADGPNGVAAARALRPDAALIDIGLPGFSGHDVARQIRADPAGSRMLLIALTGYGQREDTRKALEAGFDAHLAKPADPDRLLRLIAAGRLEPTEAAAHG